MDQKADQLAKNPDPPRAERRAAIKAWRKSKKQEISSRTPPFKEVWKFYQEKKTVDFRD